MTPQSLRDPHADKAAVDPVVGLWEKYQRLEAASQETSAAYNKAEGEYFASKPSGLTDEEDKKARATAGVTALEKADVAASNREDAVLKKIANAPVTSLEDIAIKLRALAEWTRPDLNDTVTEGIRTAIDAVEKMAQPTGPDPLVALWFEWDGVRKTRFSDHVPHGDVVDPKAETTFYDGKADEMTVIEKRIMTAVPSTLAGALVQMSVLTERGTTDIAPDIDAALAGIVGGAGRRVITAHRFILAFGAEPGARRAI